MKSWINLEALTGSGVSALFRCLLVKSAFLMRRLLCVVLLAALCGGGGLCAARERRSAEAVLAASVKKEVSLGREVAEEIAKKCSFVEDPFVTARVRGILARLTPWVNRPLPYNVHVIREKSPNAFCIPGGNLYVTTGLLDFVSSDDELAFVMAHELAHADGRHGIIQMERNQKLSLAALALIIASRGAAASIMLSNVAALAMANAYSRDLEQEADLGAVEIAFCAGYDLVAGVTVMEGLAREEQKQLYPDPGIMADHPKIADRISVIIQAVETKGRHIERKKVLRLLRTHVADDQDALVLYVDKTEILRVPSSEQNTEWLRGFQRDIDRYLQMETAYYDIRTERRGEKSVLCIGVHEVLSEPLPDESLKLPQIRANIAGALSAAQGKNFAADYTL